MIASFSPMLATPARPFDSFEYWFEIKWDGIRALAAVEAGRLRLWGRDRADYTDRYPELEGLRQLASGTVVDGELVVLHDGRADLNAVLSRHQLNRLLKIRHACRLQPVCYILFDALYEHGRPLFAQPLQQRRAVLRNLLMEVDNPALVLSEGVVGRGKDFFERVATAGHEGVMAKHLAGPYLPGRRSSSWRKIKPVQLLPCVIIGYTSAGDGLHSLLVAAPRDGVLQYVGELTCGFRRQEEAELVERLARYVRSRPVVSCPRRATWVRPELYCRVQFLQWTPKGRLRGASFRGLIDDTPQAGAVGK